MSLKTPLKGILLVDKTANTTSFHIVSLLRRLTGVEKIGHAGTLDPFATGVMVMLIGKEYTRKSADFLNSDKAYQATLKLGITTETFDIEGLVTQKSEKVPTFKEIELAIQAFQGEVAQIPPMYSAKKVNGKKLCDLARKGISIERAPVQVKLEIECVRYEYPFLEIKVQCSKGTYIRSLAHDIGQFLGCGAHLSQLTRTRSGCFKLENCVSQSDLKPPFDIQPFLQIL